ncbi:MAG TPA: helix-turn-helix domain-containing protein [Candidatus Binatia bacterium]
MEAERVEEIITPSEVAALLRIHVKTVYRLAEEGLIPGKRIGRSWRFRKSSVLQLISQNEGSEAKVHPKKD